MTTYLIDMENAHFRWGCLLSQFGEKDKLALFYSINIAAIPLQFLNEVLATNIKIETIKCYTGPNALDFQLVSELGARINANPDGSYVIVANDHGYDAVIQYWQDRNINISRYTPPAKTYPATARPIETNKTDESLEETMNVGGTIAEQPVLPNMPAEQPTEQIAAKLVKEPVVGPTRFIAAANRHVMSEHVGKNRDIHQNYVDKLHTAGIPAEHMNKVADAILMAMDKPVKRRRISIYNGILAAFGKQSGTLYYKKAEYVISDILANGPFPEF